MTEDLKDLVVSAKEFTVLFGNSVYGNISIAIGIFAYALLLGCGKIAAALNRQTRTPNPSWKGKDSI